MHTFSYLRDEFTLEWNKTTFPVFYRIVVSFFQFVIFLVLSVIWPRRCKLFDCNHLAKHLKLKPIINRYWIFLCNQFFATYHVAVESRHSLWRQIIALYIDNLILARKRYFTISSFLKTFYHLFYTFRLSFE